MAAMPTNAIAHKATYKSSTNCDIQQSSSTFNDIDDGNDEDDDAYHGNDAVDACSSEQAAKQFKQAFDDTLNESYDERDNKNNNPKCEKEFFHSIFIYDLPKLFIMCKSSPFSENGASTFRYMF